MPRESKIDIESKIISRIKTEEIKMKPRWSFTVGSFLSFSGLVGISTGLVFLISLAAFLLRRGGCLRLGRVQAALAAFPWWIPLLALVGFFGGIRLLKRYDFSYKKNFVLVAVVFAASLLLAGLLIDNLGLNEQLAKGRMKGFYQRFRGAGGGGCRLGKPGSAVRGRKWR